MLSIAIGCEYIKDINEKLAPEVLADNSFGMNRFPDQSQINALLTRMDKKSIKQLQDIHHELFMKNSNSIHTDDNIIVDLDQSGLIANGKSYELAERATLQRRKTKAGIS